MDLSEYHCHDWNQLFEVDYNLTMMTEEEMVKRWTGYSENHLFGGRLNVFVDGENINKLAKLFTLGPMLS